VASVPPSARVLDLSSLQARDRSWKRPALALFLAGIIGFALELFDFIATEPTTVLTGPWTTLKAKVDFGVDATLIFFICFLAACLPRFLAGATSLQVDDDGLTINYPSGRSMRLRWADPRMRFYIRDNSAHARLVALGSRYFLYLPTLTYPGRDRRFRLTDEAYEEIVRRARQRGASIQTSRGTGLWNRYPPQIHWIRGGSNPARAVPA
jgi:hypothetical protein